MFNVYIINMWNLYSYLYNCIYYSFSLSARDRLLRWTFRAGEGIGIEQLDRFLFRT